MAGQEEFRGSGHHPVRSRSVTQAEHSLVGGWVAAGQSMRQSVGVGLLGQGADSIRQRLTW